MNKNGLNQNFGDSQNCDFTPFNIVNVKQFL